MLSLEQCLKKHLDCFFFNAKGYIRLHYSNSHGIHLFLFKSRHEHHPAVFCFPEWDCCVQVALYLVSALHKLQLVLISEKQHFREENDLRKWCFMFCFLCGNYYVNVGRRISSMSFIQWCYGVCPWNLLYFGHLRVGVFRSDVLTLTFGGGKGMWFQLKVAMVGWNSAGLKTMKIIQSHEDWRRINDNQLSVFLPFQQIGFPIQNWSHRTWGERFF